MTDNVQNRFEAHFALFGSSAEVEADISHVQSLGKDWQPTEDESKELADYDGGEEVLDNIARFLADHHGYIGRCGGNLGNLLHRIGTEISDDDEPVEYDHAPEADKDLNPNPSTERTEINPLDAMELPPAKLKKIVLVRSVEAPPEPSAKTQSAEKKAVDQKKPEPKESSKDQAGGRPKSDSSKVEDVQEKEPIKSSFATLPKRSTQLPDSIKSLLRTPYWQTVRTMIEKEFCQSKAGDAEATVRLRAWMNRMGDYRNGFGGDDKILFGRHMTSCIGELEGGVDVNSPEYKYRYVTGIIPGDEVPS